AADGTATISRSTGLTLNKNGQVESQSMAFTQITQKGNDSLVRNYTQKTEGQTYNSSGQVTGYKRTTAEGEMVSGLAPSNHFLASPGSVKFTVETLKEAAYNAQQQMVSSRTETAETIAGVAQPVRTSILTDAAYNKAGQMESGTQATIQGQEVSLSQFSNNRYNADGQLVFSAGANARATLDEWNKEGANLLKGPKASTAFTWNKAFNIRGDVTQSLKLTEQKLFAGGVVSGLKKTLESTTNTYFADGRLKSSTTKVRESSMGLIDGAYRSLAKAYASTTEFEEYSKDGKVLKQRNIYTDDAGNETETWDEKPRRYDANGNLVETTVKTKDPDGNETETTWKAALGKNGNAVLDAQGQPLAASRVTIDGDITTTETYTGAVETDAFGRVLSQGMRVEKTGAGRAEAYETTQKYTYDIFGQVKSSKTITAKAGPDGITVRNEDEALYVYDGKGRAVRTETKGREVTRDASGKETVKPYFSVRDVLTFDSRNRVLREAVTTKKDDSPSDRRVSLADIKYNSKGQVTDSKDLVRNYGTASDGAILNKYSVQTLKDAEYDLFGRQVSYTSITESGTLVSTQKASGIKYDAMGRMTDITTESSEAQVGGAVFSTSKTVQSGMKYDAAGNLVDYEKEVTANGSTKVFKPVLAEYDHLGRAVNFLEFVQDKATGETSVSGVVGAEFNELGQQVLGFNVSAQAPEDVLTNKGTMDALKDNVLAGAFGEQVYFRDVVEVIKRAPAHRQGFFQRMKNVTRIVRIATGAKEPGEVAKSLGLEKVSVSTALERNRYDTQGRLVYSRTRNDEAAWNRAGKKDVFNFGNDKAKAEEKMKALENAGYKAELNVKEEPIYQESCDEFTGENCTKVQVGTKIVDVEVTGFKEFDERHTETTTQTLFFDALNRPVQQMMSTKDGSTKTSELRTLTYNPQGQPDKIYRSVTEKGVSADGRAYSKNYLQDQAFTYDCASEKCRGGTANANGRVTSESFRTYNESGQVAKESTLTNSNIEYNAKGERVSWTESTSSNAQPGSVSERRISNATYDLLGRLNTYDQDVYENSRLLYTERNITNAYDKRGRTILTSAQRSWGSTQGSSGLSSFDESWTNGTVQVITSYEYANPNSNAMTATTIRAIGTGTHADGAIQAQGINYTYTQSNFQYNRHGQMTGYSQSVTQIERYTVYKEVMKGVKKKVKSSQRVSMNTTETEVSGIEYDRYGRQVHSVSRSYSHGARAENRTETWTRNFDENGRPKNVERTTWSKAHIPAKKGSFMARLAITFLVPGASMFSHELLTGKGNLTGGKYIESFNHTKQVMAYTPDGRVDEIKTKTDTLENKTKVKGKNLGDRVLKTADIVVAVVAAVVGVFLPFVGAAIMLAWNMARQGISTHDLGWFGKNKDRDEAKRNAYNVYSSVINMIPGGGIVGAIAKAGANMALAKSFGADKKTMWQVGAMNAASGLMSGGGSGGGGNPYAAAIGEIVTQLGETGSEKQRNTWRVVGGFAKGAGGGKGTPEAITKGLMSAGQTYGFQEYSKRNSAKGGTEEEQFQRGMVNSQVQQLVSSVINKVSKDIADAGQANARGQTLSEYREKQNSSGSGKEPFKWTSLFGKMGNAKNPLVSGIGRVLSTVASIVGKIESPTKAFGSKLADSIFTPNTKQSPQKPSHQGPQQFQQNSLKMIVPGGFLSERQKTRKTDVASAGLMDTGSGYGNTPDIQAIKAEVNNALGRASNEEAFDYRSAIGLDEPEVTLASALGAMPGLDLFSGSSLSLGDVDVFGIGLGFTSSENKKLDQKPSLWSPVLKVMPFGEPAAQKVSQSLAHIGQAYQEEKAAQAQAKLMVWGEEFGSVVGEKLAKAEKGLAVSMKSYEAFVASAEEGKNAVREVKALIKGGNFEAINAKGLELSKADADSWAGYTKNLAQVKDLLSAGKYQEAYDLALKSENDFLEARKEVTLFQLEKMSLEVQQASIDMASGTIEAKLMSELGKALTEAQTAVKLSDKDGVGEALARLDNAGHAFDTAVKALTKGDMKSAAAALSGWMGVDIGFDKNMPGKISGALTKLGKGFLAKSMEALTGFGFLEKTGHGFETKLAVMQGRVEDMSRALALLGKGENALKKVGIPPADALKLAKGAVDGATRLSLDEGLTATQKRLAATRPDAATKMAASAVETHNAEFNLLIDRLSAAVDSRSVAGVEYVSEQLNVFAVRAAVYDFGAQVLMTRAESRDTAGGQVGRFLLGSKDLDSRTDNAAQAVFQNGRWDRAQEFGSLMAEHSERTAFG
ncbi:MAG: hypothetical protein HY548_02595, partial [Elusimicrobia bacterium]|nr:hypothetical protein [Elusimicrobiota bacterium]